VAVHPAQAQRAEQADIDAKMGADAGFAVAVLGDALVVFVDVEPRLTGPGRALEEETLTGIERLVIVDAETVGGADLAVIDQLATEVVEPGLVIGGTQAEGRSLAVVGLQVDGETGVVRPPALFHRHDAQDVTVALAEHGVIDALVVTIAVHAQQVAPDDGRPDGLAGLHAEMPLDGLRTHPVETDDLDVVDARRGPPADFDALPPGGVGCLAGGQTGQFWRCGLRGGAAAGGGLGMSGEIGGGNAVEHRLDVDVARPERGQRAADILLGQNADHLRRHGEQRADLLGLEQRRADIDGDHHVGPAALADFADRQVVDEAAIDQLAPLMIDRRQQAGYRHAGAHRRGQRAVAENHAFTGADVGGDDGQRQRQILDIPFALVGAHQLVEKQLDLLAGHNAALIGHAVGRNAALRTGQVIPRDELVAVTHFGVFRVIDEHVGPVRRGQRLAHFFRRHAGRPGPGDQCPHARPGDAINRHAQLLQNLEHADMRRPARPAAAQHEANARPGGIGGKRYGRLEKQGKNENGEQAANRHGDSLCEKKPCRSRAFIEATANYLVPMTSISTRRSGCRQSIRALVLVLPLHLSPVTGCFSPLPSV